MSAIEPMGMRFTRAQGMWFVNVDDLIESYKRTAKAYRAAAKEKDGTVALKLYAFADAVDAERKDLEKTLRDKETM